MKVLVLGASGYLGSNVYRFLNAMEGIEVTGTKSSEKGLSYLKQFNASHPRAKLHTPTVMLKENYDVIVNCLGKIEQPKTERSGELSYVLEEVKQLENIKRLFIDNRPEHHDTLLIHISSAAVYTGCKAEKKVQPIHEGCKAELSYENGLYAMRKKVGEEALLNDDLEIKDFIILRPFTIYGSNTSKQTKTFISSVDRFFENGKEGSAVNVEMHGQPNLPTPDGTAIRDYVHIDEVLYFIYLHIRLKAKNSHYIRGRVFNIGSGKGVSNMSLILKKMAEYKRSELNLKFVDREQYSAISLIADTTQHDLCVSEIEKSLENE